MADDINALLIRSLQDAIRTQPRYIPTGIIEPAIIAVGEGKCRIINMQPCNKAGKTTAGAAIMANIMWDNDKEYFDYPLYNEWPFKDNSGNTIKSGRIIATKENVAENGPIATEIKKWWPHGRYETIKHGHTFTKEYTTDTGWTIDVMSHEQRREQHEGPLKSFIWTDEPCDPDIIGAILTRLSKGGIWLLTNTPIGAGPMLDVLDDLQAKGTAIKHIYGSIRDNDIETGTPNKKGTKRGLMTKQEIDEYVASIPNGEEEARLEGKASHKSGKVYPRFDANIHCSLDYQLGSDYAKTWNNYMVMDPHHSYYPVFKWIAITPEEDVVIWNEWPTTRETKGKYYDEIRNKVQFHLGIEEQCDIIKIFDGGSIGMSPPLRRFIDPRFAEATKNTWSKDTLGIMSEFAKFSIKFEQPPFERIDQQRMVLQTLMKYDLTNPNIGKGSRFFILPHCHNSRRAYERHYLNADGSESEQYKDHIDCDRYFLGGVGDIVYRAPRVILPSQKSKSLDVRPAVITGVNRYQDEMRRVD